MSAGLFEDYFFTEISPFPAELVVWYLNTDLNHQETQFNVIL